MSQTQVYTPCKVCKSPAHLYGVCDFNKNCEERYNVFLPLSGLPVYYHQCEDCGLIFTTYCDDWSYDKYAEYIYNSEYIIVDPEWEYDRPRQNAALVNSLFSPRSTIDYGGGNGEFAKALVAQHKWDSVVSYDPFFGENKGLSRADLVTCFEVFEHTANPHTLLDNCKSLLNDDGTLYFSTLAMDFLPHRAMDAACNASYISPRNGHITIFTTTALKVLFNMHGMSLASTDNRFFTARKMNT